MPYAYNLDQLIQLANAGFYLPEHLLLDVFKKQHDSLRMAEIPQVLRDQGVNLTDNEAKFFLTCLQINGLVKENEGRYQGTYSLSTDKLKDYPFNKEPKPLFTLDHFITQEMITIYNTSRGTKVRDVLPKVLESFDQKLKGVFRAERKPIDLPLASKEFLPQFFFSIRRPNTWHLPKIYHHETFTLINEFFKDYGLSQFKNASLMQGFDFDDQALFGKLLTKYGRTSFINFVGAEQANAFFVKNKMEPVPETFADFKEGKQNQQIPQPVVDDLEKLSATQNNESLQDVTQTSANQSNVIKEDKFCLRHQQEFTNILTRLDQTTNSVERRTLIVELRAIRNCADPQKLDR